MSANLTIIRNLQDRLTAYRNVLRAYAGYRNAQAYIRGRIAVIEKRLERYGIAE